MFQEILPQDNFFLIYKTFCRLNTRKAIPLKSLQRADYFTKHINASKIIKFAGAVEILNCILHLED